MCIAPLTLDDGQQVACRYCNQCIDHKISDWQGRCIAEGKTSVASYAVTLTYGRDSMGEKLHERAVVQTYSDFQKYIKLLRRHRYTVRYFVAGEFGSKKGRVHWHAILYFGPRQPLLKRGKVVADADMSPVPPLAGVHQHGHWIANGLSRGSDKIRFNHCRVDQKGDPVYIVEDGKRKLAMWWPHGFSQWKEVHRNSVRYVCKYVQKDLYDAEAQGKLVMTKKPPLGALYFRQEAERYVAQGLAPQSLEYRFGDVRKRDGSPVRFMLKDRSAELFLDHYVASWAALRPGEKMPESPLVEGWLEYRVLRGPDPEEVGWARWIEFEQRQRDKVRVDPSRPVVKLGRLPKWSPRAEPGEAVAAFERMMREIERPIRAARYEREFEDQLEREFKNGEKLKGQEREWPVGNGVDYDPGLRDRWITRRGGSDAPRKRKRNPYPFLTD